MSNFLYAFDEPAPTVEGALPGDLVLVHREPGRYVYLSGCELDPAHYVFSELIGAWDASGEVLEGYTVDLVAYQALRPFGNQTIGDGVDAEEGMATGPLNWFQFMGNSQRKLLVAPEEGIDPRYPVDIQPYIMRFERFLDEDTGAWGWFADVYQRDPARRPENRTIGVYDSEWNFDYVAAAFKLTEIGVDAAGNPIERYRVTCPPGQQTVEREQINFALRWAAFVEGKAILGLGRDHVDAFYWDRDQNGPPQDARVVALQNVAQDWIGEFLGGQPIDTPDLMAFIGHLEDRGWSQGELTSWLAPPVGYTRISLAVKLMQGILTGALTVP